MGVGGGGRGWGDGLEWGGIDDRRYHMIRVV